MPRPERVLIDTSAFYAVVSSTDNFHQQASREFTKLIDQDHELWTTSYILVESLALIHHRLGFDVLRMFVEIAKDITQILWVNRGLHEESWRGLASVEGKGLSFVDWSTVLAARRLGAHVFTFDKGIGQFGLATLP